MIVFRSWVIILCLATSSNCVHVESKLVHLRQGAVRGYKNPEWDIFEFHGIPYATAPTDENKFMEPLPAPKWTSTFDAVKKNIICPQNEMIMQQFFPNGYETENCLIANIFVSNTNDVNKPVFVNIHGGAYLVGYGGLLEPKTLVENGNIVAVTFNYRLGVEGFLCLGTEKIPGNAGMKDMVALLRWVRKNIARFGGNPNDITLGGYSAGSSAADLLMLSEMTNGLFHKVIPESGMGLAAWSVQQDPYENAKRFAKESNVTASSIEELERFYTTASYEELTKYLYMEEKTSTFMFAPCIEGKGEDRFLTESPLNILEKGSYKILPVLTGHAGAEGYLRPDLFKDWKDKMNENFADFLPADLLFTSDTEKNNVAQEIKEFYFGKKTVDEETFEKYIDYFGDIFFNYPNLKSVELQSGAGSKSVYYYIYTFFDETTVPPFMSGVGKRPIKAAYHCAQSFAIYDLPGIPKNSEGDSNDFKDVKKTLFKIWLNFIKTGKPLPENSTMIPDGWPSATLDATPFMVLDKTPHLMTELPNDHAKFWDKIYAKYYRQPSPPPTSDNQEFYKFSEL